MVDSKTLIVFEDYNCPGTYIRGTERDMAVLDDQGGFAVKCMGVLPPESEIEPAPAWWADHDLGELEPAK
jgi:hypothetical protein